MFRWVKIKDGLALVQRLCGEERWKRIPIIAVTAHAAREDHRRGLEAGCDDYLAKPIRLRELRAKMDVFVPPHRSF
jgi:two-component system cell cycle response regulator DivK